jgi:hypothetical protein
VTITAPEVPWQELQHAFGRARDVPRVLAEVSQSQGWKLTGRLEELCNRVLHQGSIYSASPPAVQALIPMAARAGDRDRKQYYELLAEFASSARQAVRDGRAIPCCSGGDPEHGRAILAHLLDARDQFAAHLASRDRAVRCLAAALVCCSGDASVEAAQMVRRRFEIESDRDTRLELLDILTRVSGRFADWPHLLEAVLQRESGSEFRFALRHAQVRHFRAETQDAVVAEFTSLFLKACEDGVDGKGGRFFEALEWLGPERELAVLLVTLAGCGNRDVIRGVAERSLRLAFRDERTGWESKTCSLLSDGVPEPGGLSRLPGEARVLRGLLKIALMAMLWRIFPFLLRRRLRKSRDAKNRRRYRIEYHEILGSKPGVPALLTGNQRQTLTALASKTEVWMDQTNLWALFDLPGDAAGLRALVEARG